MSLSDQIDSPSAGLSGGTTTRAEAGDDTAEPSLASGFATIMEQEEDLQASTDGNTDFVNGPQAGAINRLLRDHHLRLGHNIALLEQRYQRRPPSALSAHARQGRIGWADRTAQQGEAPPASIEQLPELVAQHVRLIECITTLLTENADGQRGELILSELASNHAEMARELATLVAGNVTVRDRVLPPIIARGTAATSEANWENEGGRT
jgi:hypothetical protein